MTSTPGKSGTVKSGFTSIRPPLPCGSPASAATGAALRPPPQTTQRVLSTVPSLSVTCPGPMSVTPLPSSSSTPSFLRTSAA